MTDSTINGGSGKGELDIGSSAEELFGDLEDDSLENEIDDEIDDEIERSDWGEEVDGIEDRTAADVFNQLKSETDRIDTVSVLEDETPEEIIESADEPDETFESDDDLVEDEAALENLLLTGRTKGEEFLWIDTGDSTGPDGGESTDDTPEATAEAAIETESGTGSESDPTETGDEIDAGVSDEVGSTPAEVETDEPTSEDVQPDESDDDVDGEESVSEDSDEVEPAAESTELVAVDSEDTDLVPNEERSDESSGGLLAWIRSKLPF